MKFEEVLPALREGKRLTNATLSINSGFIVMHVPTVVDKEIIPKMTSLPEEAKAFLKDRGDIRFIDQVLRMEWSPMQEAYIATSYTPSWYDILRIDWTID